MPQLDQRPDNSQRNRRETDAAPAAGPVVQMDRVTPDSPGGGALTNPLFSGDHVLETILAGTGTLRKGAQGPAVRAVQSYLIGLGYNLGRSGADGDFGNATVIAVRAYQKANGLGSDAIIGKGTLAHMDKSGGIGPGNQTPEPSGDPSQPGQGLPTAFDEMWAAHPHNYQDDASENTDSGDLQVQQG